MINLNNKRMRVSLISYLIILTLIVPLTVFTGQKNVKAEQVYRIKVEGTNNYLYAEGNVVSVGVLNNSDTRFNWNVIQKSDGTYWIQNQSAGSYMAIENQTGRIELLETIYEVWASSKWNLNLSSSTTIQSAWLGSEANMNVSGSALVYGNGVQKFIFESASDNTGGDENPGEDIGGNTGGKITIPASDSNISSIGADMPYTRYDSKIAKLGGNAVIAGSPSYDKDNIASQASEQSYIRLPNSGAYAEWTMTTTGNGVTMRFTMPDSADGYGQNGSLDVYVNGNKVKTVDLTSYFMWQYFEEPNPAVNPTGSPKDEPVSGATPCFAFDEVHFRLNASLQKGDRIRIQSSGANGLEYGVDFLEIEETGAAISRPANSYSVVDYGAVPNDGQDDYAAISNCVQDAANNGKTVYFPEGEFNIGCMWVINASNIKITGAGMWYTTIKFTNPNKASGGISGSNANNIEFCNMYINSALRSRYGQEAIYKCFMDVWSGGSYIHDIWEEHFECGFWLADYNFSNGTDYSDGIIIANSRIRNNLADGVNFCQGTSNATVYNCSIRNNGDDGLAMWNNNYQVKDESGNVFCYNTIDFIWRAGAIAIYGGNNHKIYNNYIADTSMASGIHVNTAFDGYKFTNNNDGIIFANNIIVRSGTWSDSWNADLAAVDISEPGGQVKNLTFNNTYVYNSQHEARRVSGNPVNIAFNNFNIYNNCADNDIPLGKNKVSDGIYEEETTERETTTCQETTVEQETTTCQQNNTIEDGIEFNGFQIYTKQTGIKMIASVEPTINGKAVVSHGFMFGIVDDKYSDNEMVAGSNNPSIRQFESTELGISSVSFSDSDEAKSYMMTIIKNGQTKEALTQEYKIRAYAKLEDGSYVYTNIYGYRMFDIAKKLYDGGKMSSNEAHDFIYQNILKIVEPDYRKIDFDWNSPIIK